MLNRNKQFALVALIALAPACSNEFTGVGEGIDPGTFTLRTINGQTVPLTAAIRNGVRIEILDGSLTIESTYQVSNTTTYRRTDTNGQVTTSTEKCVGTYNATITTNGVTTLVFSEKGSENPQCGVQLGVGGRDRNYSGSFDGAHNLTVDFDLTTHSAYNK